MLARKKSPQANFNVDDFGNAYIQCVCMTLRNCQTSVPLPTPDDSSSENISGSYFSFVGVLRYDVAIALGQVKSNSVGLDGISLKFIGLASIVNEDYTRVYTKTFFFILIRQKKKEVFCFRFRI